MRVRETKRVECERCKRTVEEASSERVAIPSVVAEPVEHLLCSRCADEVRRGLLPALAGAKPLPAPQVTEREKRPAPAARVGWFLVRLAVYALIALAVFAIVTWLSVR